MPHGIRVCLLEPRDGLVSCEHRLEVFGQRNILKWHSGVRTIFLHGLQAQRVQRRDLSKLLLVEHRHVHLAAPAPKPFHRTVTLLQFCTKTGNVRVGGLTGQSLPILRCEKYCTLRGQSGYIFTSPIIRDRTRMQLSFAPLQRTDGFQASEAVMRVTRAATRHSSLSNGRSALKQEVKSLCLKVRNPAGE